MKKLFLIRHAKSSWKEHSKSDHERPLNERGQKDAPEMARLLKKRNIKPGLILSSDAVRAKETAIIFAKVLSYPMEEIIYDSSLYLAGQFDFIKLVNSINDNIDCCLLVSHNPGISGFAHYLTGSNKTDMPTCAVYGIEFDLETWRSVKERSGKEILFEYPKMHLKD